MPLGFRVHTRKTVTIWFVILSHTRKTVTEKNHSGSQAWYRGLKDVRLLPTILLRACPSRSNLLKTPTFGPEPLNVCALHPLNYGNTIHWFLRNLPINYMTWYWGPPPPSGTVQSIYSCGILIEQHLQWMLLKFRSKTWCRKRMSAVPSWRAIIYYVNNNVDSAYQFWALITNFSSTYS